jgi:hypothetical protein
MAGSSRSLDVVLRRAAFLAVLLSGLLSSAVGAATIQYRAIDLPDETPGLDLWEYQYTLSGVSLLAGQGFDVYFPVADGFQFGALVAPQLAPSSDWDVLAIQPDPALPADGLFDVVALVDAPSPGGPFTATFIWPGNGTPGPQSFEIFDEQLQVTESGVTTLVPEPATAALLLAGLIGAAAFARAPTRR